MTYFLELFISTLEGKFLAKGKTEVARRVSARLKNACSESERNSLYDQLLSVKAGSLKAKNRRTDFGVGLPPLAVK